MCLKVCSEIAWGAVRAMTALVGAGEAPGGSCVGGRVCCTQGEGSMAWLLWHLQPRFTRVDVHRYLVLTDCVLDVPEEHKSYMMEMGC